MMKTFMRLALVAMLVVVAAPSYSSEAWQVFTCEIVGDTVEDDLLAMGSEWLKAARSMKGGANIEVEVAFPVAAQMGDTDLQLLIKLPTFKEWGEFWDGYHDSPAAKIDDKYADKIACPDSRLFEVEKVK